MLIQGNSLHIPLKDESVQCCVTSPPYYGLRDYGVENQLGLEESPDEYVSNMVDVFREVRRVLKKDGTLWLNIGDSYAASGKSRGTGGFGENSSKQKTSKGSYFNSEINGKVPDGCKPKDLIGIPWMLAFALRNDGWYLRQDLIWHKPNPMPESVRDRCTKAHEYMFLLSKSQKYFYDADAIKIAGAGNKWGKYSNPKYGDGSLGKMKSTKEMTAVEYIEKYKVVNKRSVWTVTTKPYKGAHFATFPQKLIEPCILAGSRPNDIVLDPFSGAATTGLVAERLGRKYVGIELNMDYIDMSIKRLSHNQLRLVA